MVFDTTEPDYNHPSLPKHLMYGVGWLARELGGDATTMLVSMRLISVLLGGLTVVLVYKITKSISKNIYIPVLASFFVLSNMVLVHNARFAHNDLYLLFFITFSLFSLIKYRISENRLWLYLASFFVGCAASSKYTGASFSLVVIAVFFIENRKEFFTNWLKVLEKTFISVSLAFLGYAIGTPKILLWMAFYLKRMVPAALRQSVYGEILENSRGWTAQWSVFKEAVGPVFYYLFLFSFIWYLFQWGYRRKERKLQENKKDKAISVILLAIALFNLPYLFSYNLETRFFLPFLPMFALLAALFIEDALKYAHQKDYQYAVPVIWIASIFIIMLSLTYTTSIMLLFKNDTRIPASEFLRELEPNRNIEYTLYPPQIDKEYFSIARNYPIHFIKYPGDVAPTNKPYIYNQGEEGLMSRDIDYLVIDSFTYARCETESIYKTNSSECDFFERLLADETTYEMIGEFTYSLPPFLPQISVAFVNPEIQVFQKRE